MVAKIDATREVIQPKPVAKPAPAVKPARPQLADEMSNGAGRALRTAAVKTLASTPFTASAPLTSSPASFRVSAFGGLVPGGVTNLYSPAGATNPGDILKNPVNFCPNTPPLSDADQKSASQAIQNASDSIPPDASKISDWLQAHPDPVAQRGFWEYFKNFPEAAGRVLDGTSRCTNDQKALISSSLDASYKSGDISDDDIKKMVSDGTYPVTSDSAFGELIGGTHDPALINTFANTELSKMGNDPYRDRAVASALAGMPPDAMQAYLGQHPTLIHDLVSSPDAAGARSAATVLAHLPPDQLQQWLADPANKGDYDSMLSNINKDQDNIALDDDDSVASQSTALGDLLKNAANIQPPTPEVTDLFSKSVDLAKGNDASLQGLASVYVHDSVALTKALTADGDSEGPTVLSKFFAQALFSPGVKDENFDGSGFKLTDVVTGALKTASSALQSEFGGDDKDVAGRQLGRLGASLEGAAAVTLKDYRDQVAANKDERDAFGGLIGKALGAVVPDVPGKDFAVDKISGLLSDALIPAPGRPDISLREKFNDLFEGQVSAYDQSQTPHTNLTTDYDAGFAKSAIDIHDQLGINFDGTSAG
jgi:hypothetical protein